MIQLTKPPNREGSDGRTKLADIDQNRSECTSLVARIPCGKSNEQHLFIHCSIWIPRIFTIRIHVKRILVTITFQLLHCFRKMLF